MNFIENYRNDALQTFRSYKALADKSISRVNDDEFFRTLDINSNSIALLVKHIAGNQLSRWTEFLTSDGEKPDRFRDTEFEILDDSRDTLMKMWNRGWSQLFESIGGLSDDDFKKVVYIRGEEHTVVEAINRQLSHYSYHVGQIVLLAKHFRSSGWESLSVPKNRSAEFNEFLRNKRLRGEKKSSPVGGALEFGEQD